MVGWAAFAAACVIACGGNRPANTGVDTTQADTIIGTLQLVGTDAFPRVILVPAVSGLTLNLIGPPILRRVDGLQVQVAGRLAGEQFYVKSFMVLSANGQQATDGHLIVDGGVYYLVTQDGARHQLVNPPPNLRGHVGGRVWVSGPLDREPIAYGIIQ
jgi:hypothetical protein